MRQRENTVSLLFCCIVCVSSEGQHGRKKGGVVAWWSYGQGFPTSVLSHRLHTLWGMSSTSQLLPLFINTDPSWGLKMETSCWDQLLVFFISTKSCLSNITALNTISQLNMLKKSTSHFAFRFFEKSKLIHEISCLEKNVPLREERFHTTPNNMYKIQTDWLGYMSPEVQTHTFNQLSNVWLLIYWLHVWKIKFLNVSTDSFRLLWSEPSTCGHISIRWAHHLVKMKRIIPEWETHPLKRKEFYKYPKTYMSEGTNIKGDLLLMEKCNKDQMQTGFTSMQQLLNFLFVLLHDETLL